MIDENGNEEDKQGGLFSSFTGYLGKKTEKKPEEIQPPAEQETMIAKAKTRH